MATAIISAFDAVIYLKLLWPAAGLFSSVLKRFFIILKYCSSDIRLITVAIILFFTGVTCMGVKESAAVSLMMFLFHLLVLLVLIIWALAYGFNDDFNLFNSNMRTDLPDVLSSDGELLAHNSVIGAIFYGYCAALLGITGFESAANYVEEMENPAVFVGTVNWMW